MSNQVRTKADTAAVFRKYSAAILLAVFLVLNAVITPNFFSAGTFRNIITQSCTIILTGVGMTMVISTGGIDLSVGAVMALAGITSAHFLSLGVFPAILLAVFFSAVSGGIAGFFVGKLKVQAMVVTLALMIGVRGVAQVISDAKIIRVQGENADAFTTLGSLKLFGFIPIQIVPIILAIAIVWFILEKTILGRYIQAVGDNAESAKYAGINSARTLIFVYIFCAILAGVAGIFATAKNAAADGNTLGLLSELDAIAAVAIGGTSMAGGRARIFGTVIGALIMQLITVTVNMNNIPYEYAQVLKAIIIIVAVYIQRDKNS